MLVAEAFSRVLNAANPLNFEECHSLTGLTPEQATEEQQWTSGVSAHTASSAHQSSNVDTTGSKSKHDKMPVGTGVSKIGSKPVSAEIDPDEIVNSDSGDSGS